jgi:hypothetical protein
MGAKSGRLLVLVALPTGEAARLEARLPDGVALALAVVPIGGRMGEEAPEGLVGTILGTERVASPEVV